jgi:preprotein translocase subunit YajC
VGPFILIVVVFAAIWFIFLLPARRKRSSHAAMQDSIGVGDEIITAGGMHGVVKEVDDDLLKIEIAAGVVVTLDRRAVAAVAREIEVEVEPGDEHDAADHDGAFDPSAEHDVDTPAETAEREH